MLPGLLTSVYTFWKILYIQHILSRKILGNAIFFFPCLLTTLSPNSISRFYKNIYTNCFWIIIRNYLCLDPPYNNNSPQPPVAIGSFSLLDRFLIKRSGYLNGKHAPTTNLEYAYN